MTHNQHESEIKGKKLQEEREELLEKARKAREARMRHHSPPHEDEGQVDRPPPDDPRFNDPSVPADQVDIPSGGSTGGAMGMSSKRKKHPSG